MSGGRRPLARSDGRVILFLDFDGVLHPSTPTGSSAGEPFTSLALLEDVLRQAPHVDVVISSSWREAHPLQEMRGYFAPDLRERIVDATPLRFAESEWPHDIRAHRRHAECLEWLRRHAPGTPWVAVDDQHWIWPPGCPNLLLIDGAAALTADTARELLRRLHAAGASNQ